MRIAILAIATFMLALLPGNVHAASPVYQEFVEGSPDAKVTVIEYASLTCPHCAHFHVEGYPQLKKNYIDTGRIKFIFRDLPTAPEQLAVAAALLARCVPNGRGMTLISTLFKNQQEWTKSPEERLRHYTSLAGMSKEDFDACLMNEAILKEMERVANAATNVEETPTFLINDERVASSEYADIAKAIDAALAKAK